MSKTKRDTNAFDDCVQQSIKLARKYMSDTTMSKKPTQQEYDLALILYQYQLIIMRK